MSTNVELLQKLTGVVSVISPKYVEAMLFLHEKWAGTGVEWIVNGALAESLKTVYVQPDCIEIVCTKTGAEQLHEAVKDLNPTPLNLQITQLPKAVIDGNQYPVYAKSHSFELSVKSVLVRVQGDLQFRVADWEWGDTFEFQPEYVSVVGKKIAVTPLPVLFKLYSDLGWAEQAGRVRRVLQRRVIRQ